MDEVREAIGAAGLDPPALLLEITETALVRDTDGSFRALGRLQSLGVRIALDDFGTGYSSPHYLARFPVDTMKIAKVFVDDVGVRGREPKMVRAMMRLAEVFDLRVIAEGIERAEQVPRFDQAGMRARAREPLLAAAPARAGRAAAERLRSTRWRGSRTTASATSSSMGRSTPRT